MQHKLANRYIAMSTELTLPRLKQLDNPMWHN